MRPVPLRFIGSSLPTLIPLGLCALMGYGVWRALGGGVIGSDGEWQLQQALAGRFNDWLSPTMTALMRQGLYHFYAIAPVVLIQSIVICLGLFHLVRANLRFVRTVPASATREAIHVVAIVAILLVPPSPLPHFMVYVQSDGWLLAGLFWSLAGWLNLELTHSERSESWEIRLARLGWWAAAVLGSGWMVLMRYNAVVLLPVFALLAINAARHRPRFARALIAAGIVLLPWGAGRWIDQKYRVEHVHPEDQIMALDLVGVCVECEEIRERLPYTNAHLLDDRFRRLYIPGFVNIYYWYSPEESRPTRFDFVGERDGAVQRYGSRHEELAGDYWEAIRLAPLSLARVKWAAFTAYLKNDQVMHWRPTGGLPEAFGRKPTTPPAFQAASAQVDEMMARSPLLRFIFCCHMPWFFLCLFIMLCLGFTIRHHGLSNKWRTVLYIMLIPTVYYLSHLLAVAGHWYRYMYPATLLMQIEFLVVASLTGAALWQKLRSKSASEQVVLDWRVRVPTKASEAAAAAEAPERTSVAGYTHTHQPG